MFKEYSIQGTVFLGLSNETETCYYFLSIFFYKNFGVYNNNNCPNSLKNTFKTKNKLHLHLFYNIESILTQ